VKPSAAERFGRRRIFNARTSKPEVMHGESPQIVRLSPCGPFAGLQGVNMRHKTTGVAILITWHRRAVENGLLSTINGRIK